MKKKVTKNKKKSVFLPAFTLIGMGLGFLFTELFKKDLFIGCLFICMGIGILLDRFYNPSQ